MPASLARAALLFTLAALPLASAAYDLNDVAARAQALAQKPYQPPATRLPEVLRDLSYDQYRDIRFKPEKSLWRGTRLPFELQFFHTGLYYTQPVRINLVSADGVRQFPYNPELFDFGKNDFDPMTLGDVGYAGFRVHYPLNNSEYKDEVLVFQGASYFRALGQHQRYGLSARGLAVDTGMLSGEEFPAFTEFWIVWPSPHSTQLEILALMDSRRVTGAYRFIVKPGVETTMDVEAKLFLREPVGKLGIAPLTSMFLFGENQPSPAQDYRPEVHDSDGLMIQAANGEWIWRPLVNPKRLLVTSFSEENPRGFGLMQRDQNFDHYQDLEARYELRPSAWVTPKGDWGKGRVELVLIPTPDETNDNIVAYWVPEAQPQPGEALDIAYRLSWQHDTQTLPPLGHITQSRRGHGYLREPDDTIRMLVDFKGGALDALAKDAKPVANIWIGDNGKLLEHQLFRNEATGGWRLSLRFARGDASERVELRAGLEYEQVPVSETWSYILPGQ